MRLEIIHENLTIVVEDVAEAEIVGEALALRTCENTGEVVASHSNEYDEYAPVAAV